MMPTPQVASSVSKGPVVNPLNDAAFYHQAEKPDDDEGDRYGGKRIAAELADNGGGIGADHDQLAMRHVDDAGHAEDDRQPDRRDHQDRHHTEAAEKLRDDGLQHSVPVGIARVDPHACRGAGQRPCNGCAPGL